MSNAMALVFGQSSCCYVLWAGSSTEEYWAKLSCSELGHWHAGYMHKTEESIVITTN